MSSAAGGGSRALARITPEGAPIGGRRRLRRDVRVVGLLFTSVGSTIGSGWLFGALSASKIAGPAALLSWLLGGRAMILLTLAIYALAVRMRLSREAVEERVGDLEAEAQEIDATLPQTQ